MERLQGCKLAEWLMPTGDKEQEEGHERAEGKEDNLEEEEGGDGVGEGREAAKDERQRANLEDGCEADMILLCFISILV